jgi:hypothetical protein
VLAAVMNRIGSLLPPPFVGFSDTNIASSQGALAFIAQV